MHIHYITVSLHFVQRVVEKGIVIGYWHSVTVCQQGTRNHLQWLILYQQDFFYCFAIMTEIVFIVFSAELRYLILCVYFVHRLIAIISNYVTLFLYGTTWGRCCLPFYFVYLYSWVCLPNVQSPVCWTSFVIVVRAFCLCFVYSCHPLSNIEMFMIV